MTGRKAFSTVALGVALCGSTQVSHAGPSRPTGWDRAFEDRSGARPVHFIAEYVDAQGATHRLEEWRVGLAHLRRKTDARIDLHADAAGPAKAGPVEYVWQVLDLEKRIDHRVSSAGMMRAGMFYSYYAMSHVLNRPAGSFTVFTVAAEPVRADAQTGRWFEVDADGQPAMRICWDAALGIPLTTQVKSGAAWKTTFRVLSVDGRVDPGVFAVDARGFRVQDIDRMQTED